MIGIERLRALVAEAAAHRAAIETALAELQESARELTADTERGGGKVSDARPD